MLTPDWRPPFAPNGLILLRRIPPRAAHQASSELALTPSQLQKLAKKTEWIEIEVVDQDDKPFTGAYRLELSDNRVLEGNLGDGFYGNYDIDPGNCKLYLYEKGTLSPATLTTSQPAAASPPPAGRA
jgi:hypothetical protein